MAFVSLKPSVAALPVLLEKHEGEYAIHGWQNLDIMVWMAPITRAGLERLHLYLPRRVHDLKGKVSLVHLIAYGATSSSAESRFAAVEYANRSRMHVACSVTVIEQEGFWGSAIRALATGVHMMTSQRLITRIVSSRREAAAWLPEVHRRETGVVIDEQALLDVIESVRRAYP